MGLIHRDFDLIAPAAATAPGGAAGSVTLGMSNLGNTSGTTGVVSGSDVRYLFAGGNNVTLSQSLNGLSGTVTISAANQTVQPGIQSISAGTTRATTGEVVFSNSNGIAFGLNGQTITASYTVPTVPGQFTGGFSTNGNTAGDTGLVTGRMVLIGGNNITLSGSTNGGSISITISGAAAGGAVGSISAGTTRATLGEAVFSNSNGISFGVNGQTVTASYTVPTVPAQMSAGMSTNGNTAGDTGLVTGRLVLIGGNNITLSGSTNAGSMSISISAPPQFSAGISTGGNTSGDTGVVTGRVVFAGTNITLSGSTNGGSMTITISAGAGGAGDGALSAGMSTQGNTAGDTGLVASQLIIVGGSAARLSQSVNGVSATLSIHAGPTISYFSNMQGGPIASYSAPTSSAAGALSFQNVFIDAYMTATRLDAMIHLTVAGSTNCSYTLSVAAYSIVNSSSLSRLSSTSVGVTMTSGTNSTAASVYGANSGTRFRSLSLNSWAFTPGNYIFAFMGSIAGVAGTTGSWSWYGKSGISLNNDIASSVLRPYFVDMQYTAATAAFPANVGLSDLDAGGANNRKQAFFQMAGV